jgi:hypothetical protein
MHKTLDSILTTARKKRKLSKYVARHLWLKPGILATWEAEIERTEV